MILSNFVLARVRGTSAINLEYFAEVDVTVTVFLGRSITVRKEIRRTFVGAWHFTETGEYTPSDLAERLERVWEAKHGLLPKSPWSGENHA